MTKKHWQRQGKVKCPRCGQHVENTTTPHRVERRDGGSTDNLECGEEGPTALELAFQRATRIG